MKILVFDTETTGLPTNKYECQRGKWYKYWGHIVQLSWILYDTNTSTIVSKEDTIVKLPDTIDLPESSIAIHGITRDIMREKGIDIHTSLSMFRTALDSCDMILGHNIEFDINMVRAEMLRSGAIDYFLLLNVDIVCTMKKYTNLCKIMRKSYTGRTYFKYPKLIELYQKVFPENSIPSNLHNALIDVYVCLMCYIKLEHGVTLCDPSHYFH